MLLLWCLAGAAFVLASLALLATRHTARRLEQITRKYWELQYEVTKPRPGSDDERPAPPSPAAPEGSFVSLASLKKKAGDAGE